MKNNFFKYFSIALLILISFFIWQNSVSAINAPTISFTGDDFNQNGGTDDPYDALIIVDANTSQPSFLSYEMQYSDDDGQNWSAIVADSVPWGGSHFKYYWSTSVINYAPVLLFRVRSVHQGQSGEEYSDYYQATLSLAHRQTNATARFFAEHFVTNDYNHDSPPPPSTNANWDINKGLLEARSNANRYFSSEAYSENLLPEDGSVGKVTSVTFQPVQYDFGQTIQYWLSNNGSNWYGPYSFSGQIVPAAIEVHFNSSVGEQLYWKANLTITDRTVSPRVYQLRFNWTENYLPQACFTVNPTSDLIDPERVFVFNANCSSDLEDPLSQLDFRWDWNSDGGFDTEWLTSYNSSNIFYSTSTSFTITLQVKDTYEEVDSYQSSINEESLAGDVYGWLWSAINQNDLGYGWTSLNCDNIYYGEEINLCGDSNYGVSMDAQNIWGWAWNPYLGWLCLGNTCDFYGQAPAAPIDPQATYSRSDGEVNGWGKYIMWGELGWLQLNGNWCGAEEYNCTNLNLSNRTLDGFAWAGGYNESYPAELIGPGWQRFSGYVNLPWLETLYGSVYGKGNVGSSQTAGPSQGRYSATYCILAGGEIINFTSQLGCEEQDYPEIEFPKNSNQYRNILGLIDFNQILDGEEITSSSQDVDGVLPNILAGQVYSFTGSAADYYINEPFIIYNARNLDSSGAGTVVIDGNLHIDSNFYYEDVPTTAQIENLASVAWVVKGDVIINPAVNHIVGTFIVLGADGVSCPSAACGKFQTGNDLTNPKQLVAQGLVMAKQMDWQRYYKVGGEPAEQIIYDGRVLVNTPPGLEDVAKGLPIWRETFATSQIEE